MEPIIGWDIGGAHLKAVRVEAGVVTRVAQVPSPLWLGLDRLATAFDAAFGRVGRAPRHCITMTGEVADAFASRAAGVEALAAIAAERLAPGRIAIYGGRAGLLRPSELPCHISDIASANWHATAFWAARAVTGGLLIDMGSTTTDIVPFAGNNVAASGYTDFERLAAGELVYTGLVRTPLMALAREMPFKGHAVPLMNEYFATTADIYRIIGRLPRGADQQATADGREKTVAASRARLARMIGLDAADAPDEAWASLAEAFAEAQRRALQDAAARVASRSGLPHDAPVIGAGVGAGIVRELSSRLRRRYIPFFRLLPCASPKVARAAADAAPAASVALLAEALPDLAGRRRSTATSRRRRPANHGP